MHQGGLTPRPRSENSRSPMPSRSGPSRSGPSPWGRTALATSRIPWRDRKLRSKLITDGVGVVQDQLSQVATVGAAEAVDGLRLIADDREPPAVRRQEAHDVDL